MNHLDRLRLRQTACGHSVDSGLDTADREAEPFGSDGRERTQTAFFTATFSVMGHLSKADGQVTPAIIEAIADRPRAAAA